MTLRPRDEVAKKEIEALREAVAYRVEATTLRGVGRESGMSPTGLKKFLLGTDPYQPTIDKLRRWYLKYSAVQDSRVAHVDAAAAVAVLTHEFFPTGRQEAVSEIMEILRRMYFRSGRQPPTWIDQLRREHGLEGREHDYTVDR